jgi:hypothetical protein
LVLAIEIGINGDEVALASVFKWQPLEVTDLLFSRRPRKRRAAE